MIIALNFIALPDERGSGAFHYIHNLLAVMGEYTLSDTHFIVYKQKHIHAEYIGMPENADVEYIDVPTLGNGWKRILFEQTLFYRYLKPCDVFYSYCTSLPLWVRAKRVFTLHDVYYLTEKERYGWLQRTYLTYITRLYVRCADSVLTVSGYSKQQIEKYLPAAQGKIQLTYNILPDRAVQPQPVNIEDKSFFLFVGSIQPGKNIIRMTDGFAKFNKDGQHQLLIVGKPMNGSKAILEHIAGITDVHYLGYRSDEEIIYLYQRTQAVVLLSLCEGFGIPPLEGFQYGKPALVADATSLPEVVGEAGIKINPLDTDAIADGFRQVLAQKECLVAHTDEQIRRFNKKESCETWMNCLEIQYVS